MSTYVWHSTIIPIGIPGFAARCHTISPPDAGLRARGTLQVIAGDTATVAYVSCRLIAYPSAATGRGSRNLGLVQFAPGRAVRVSSRSGKWTSYSVAEYRQVGGTWRLYRYHGRRSRQGLAKSDMAAMIQAAASLSLTLDA